MSYSLHKQMALLLSCLLVNCGTWAGDALPFGVVMILSWRRQYSYTIGGYNDAFGER